MKAAFELETTAYNMYFSTTSGFRIDNIEFTPIEAFWKEYRDRSDKLLEKPSGKKLLEDNFWRRQEQHPTATVKIGLTCCEEDLEQEVERTKEILHNYSILLSFAHGHHVHFMGLDCYKGSGGSRKCFSTRGLGGRMGKPGIEPSNITGRGVEPFLIHTASLFKDSDFVERTQIRRAMIWYNEVQCLTEGMPFEAAFPSLWTTLEILAGAHALETGNELLKDAGRLDEIKRSFGATLRKLNVSQSASWLAKLTGYTSVMNRVRKLAKKYNLKQYEPELKRFYELRNVIVHGHSFKMGNDEVDCLLRLHRFAEKIILKILNFYDRKDMVHSAITRDDLRATR